MLCIVAHDTVCARTMPIKSPFSSVMPVNLHRHVGAGPHRDADMGRGQRGGIVDAVARHRDDPAFGLQPLHDRGLVLGKTSATTTWSMPSSRPTASAVVLPSPGSMTAYAGRKREASAEDNGAETRGELRPLSGC